MCILNANYEKFTLMTLSLGKTSVKIDTGWAKWVYSCEDVKHRVFSCIIIYYHIIFHTNYEPPFAHPCMKKWTC